MGSLRCRQCAVQSARYVDKQRRIRLSGFPPQGQAAHWVGINDGHASCPCALCLDGGRMIDVYEDGWETTLRGEPAEIYARWREDLKPAGFRLDARIVGYDEQGAIAEAGLFLAWGAKAGV